LLQQDLQRNIYFFQNYSPVPAVFFLHILQAIERRCASIKGKPWWSFS